MANLEKEVNWLDLLDTLRKLCAAPGPSGFERPAAEAAMELLRPLVDEVRLDRLGNVVGMRRCGRPEAWKFLLDAHLERVGPHHYRNRRRVFLRFHTLVGGVDARCCPPRKILCADRARPSPAVVACLPPHVLERGEEDKAIAADKLYLDVGFTQAQTEERIQIGTPAVLIRELQPLGKHQVSARALDDRAGFAVLLRVLELLKEKRLGVDLYVLGSIREETSGAGAITGAFGIAPDFCVAVDVTHGRTPDAPKEGTFPLGGGVAIGVGPNMTKSLSDKLAALAKERNIPLRRRLWPGTADKRLALPGFPRGDTDGGSVRPAQIHAQPRGNDRPAGRGSVRAAACRLCGDSGRGAVGC